MLIFRLILAGLLLPSVYLSYQSSLVDPAWHIVPALISGALLIFLFSEIYARFAPGWQRLLGGILLITPIACYLFAQLLSFELQGSYFNQRFFYHFNVTTLVSSWGVYYRVFLIFALWLLALWLLLLRYSNKSLQTSVLPTRALPLVLLAIIVCDPGLNRSTRYAAAYALSNHDLILQQINWRRLQLHEAAVSAQQQAVEPGRNLVLVFMEGLEKVYTDESLFPGLTPNLNRYARQGQTLDNLTQMTGSGWTIAGMVSTLCGTPLLYNSDVNGNEIDFSGFLTRATCTPDLLARADYQQVFMGGASVDFANKGNFLSAHSYDRVLGRDSLREDIADPDYLNGWGLYDDSLFRLAAEEFSRLADSQRPFNLTLLTVDTHHPTGNPSRSCKPYAPQDNSILDAVHCTDYLVGEFLDRISRHPAYANTVVVLVSDHLAMPNEALPLIPEDYERRLFFTVLNAERPLHPQQQSQPVDLAPTLLSAMGVQYQHRFLVGFDLTRVERPPLLHDALLMQQENTVSYINGSIYSADSSAM